MEQYTKTSRLPVQDNMLARQRVDSLIEQGIQQSPAVMVAAGAGFGKTQAVAGFLGRSAYRRVWQQLTLLDNLPPRFWASFVHTVSLHRPQLGAKLEELGFPDSLYKYHRFLQLFTEELYVDDQFVVFVFDDFHLLYDESVMSFFRHFLSANLENICLVFITRKLEAGIFHGKIHVITAEDLRFTRGETAAFLESRGVRAQSGAEIGELHAYAEGWPVAVGLLGLQLAKGSLKIEKNLLDSQSVLFVLIDQEIFSAYSPEAQRFFVSLSTLHSFPQGLAERIGDGMKENTAALLRNCMFASYDPKAESYYLHQIFLDFLAEKRSEDEDERIEGVLREAGDWCWENKYFLDAIEYYDRCDAKDGIVQVLQGFEGRRHPRGDAELYMRYIRRFSGGILQQNAMCEVIYAMLLLNNLQVAEAQEQIRSVLMRLRERENTPENASLRGEAAAGAGLVALSVGDPRFAALFREAAALLPDGSGHWGKRLRIIEYGNALCVSDTEPGAAEECVRRLSDAEPYVSAVLHGAGRGAAHLAAAEMHFLRCQFREAQEEAYKAVYASGDDAQRDVMDNAWFLLLRIFLATGATKKIEEALEQLQGKDGSEAGHVRDIAAGWLYSEIGAVKRVADWIVYADENTQPPISIDKDALLHIRCLIEKKDDGKALAVAEKLEAILRKRNVWISLIYVLVYRAIICYHMEDVERSERTLAQAYALAAGNGFMMPFIEFGHKTRPMLAYFSKHGCEGIPKEWIALAHTRASTYAKRRSNIVSQFSRYRADTPRDYGLTRREIELLGNMSQGLTREEIALAMYISPHTVKSMLKTVYSKIGAVNGADAVRIASGADLIL